MSDLLPEPDDFVGAYRIVRPIGKGGMGAVFEAVHTRTGQPAAIKVLHARFTNDTEALARFLAEGRATAKLDHPSIVRILETGQLPSGACYIAMEYLRGETLGTRLKREGRLGRAALRIGSQIAGALVQAHKKNIVHRDLKPSNLILSEEDADGVGRDQIKIIDFGIAKISGDDKESSDFRTRTGTMIGTPVYMSPEQCRGVAVTDRTDVYALGIILYQALAGRPPFVSKADGDILAMHILVAPRPLREVEPAIPSSVAAFIDRMLTKDAAERPGMAAVAVELVALAEDPDWHPTATALLGNESADEHPPTMNEQLQAAPPTLRTPPSTPRVPVTSPVTGSVTAGPVTGSVTGPVTGQSASVSSRRASVGPRRLILGAAAGLVVLSLAGALLVRRGRGSTPQVVSAGAAATAAKPAPAGPQVTPLASGNPALPAPVSPTASAPVSPIASAPTNVHWAVRSQPAGALVLGERGETLGTTPLLRDSPRQDGTQTVILRLAGYRDAQLSLSLSSDEEREAELVAAAPPGKSGKGSVKNPSKRGGKQRAGQGKPTADDTPILLDFKTKKVLKTQ